MKDKKIKDSFLKNKKVIYIHLFSLLILVAIGVFVNNSINKKLTVQKARTANVIFNIVSNEFHEIVENAERELEDWAKEVESGEYSNVCETDHTIILSKYEFVINYGVVDNEGYSICSHIEMPEGFNFNEDIEEYPELVKNEAFTVTNFGYSKTTGLSRIAFGFPVFDSNDTFNGSVWTNFNLQKINDDIEELGLPEDSELLITDRNGSVLISYPNNPSLLGQRKFSTQIFSLILSEKAGSVIIKEDGKEIIYIYKPYYFNDSDVPVGFIIYGTEAPGSIFF